MDRYGLTIPLAGRSLAEHRAVVAGLADLGYTDVWSAEANGHDAFTPLALAAAWTPSLRLGTAVVPAFTRGPGLLAQTVASLVDAAPGRLAFGIGTSSGVIVERWNDLEFDRPYQRVRDTIRFLRAALSGEKVTAEYETFSVRGFRLGVHVDEPPPILVGALRPGMLKLAGTEGDGAIVNWLSAEDVATVAPYVNGKELAARIFVLPTEDRDTLQFVARRMIAEYLNVPVYAAFHDWLGRGELLQPMWDKWKAGDRKGATEAIPDALIDQLVVHGSPEQCRAHLQRYVDNGITTPAPAILAAPDDARRMLRALAPGAI
jgi:probable F420-dependent oxidoreductase